MSSSWASCKTEHQTFAADIFDKVRKDHRSVQHNDGVREGGRDGFLGERTEIGIVHHVSTAVSLRGTFEALGGTLSGFKWQN